MQTFFLNLLTAHASLRLAATLHSTFNFSLSLFYPDPSYKSQPVLLFFHLFYWSALDPLFYMSVLSLSMICRSLRGDNWDISDIRETDKLFRICFPFYRSSVWQFFFFFDLSLLLYKRKKKKIFHKYHSSHHHYTSIKRMGQK